MKKRVLDVGNCGPDHASISRALQRYFDVEVVAADDLQGTLTELRRHAFDLVLINRKLDVDYSDGIEILRSIKALEEFHDLPVMLISNYPEYQAQAVTEGAILGFGKLELNSPVVQERLSGILG